MNENNVTKEVIDRLSLGCDDKEKEIVEILKEIISTLNKTGLNYEEIRKWLKQEEELKYKKMLNWIDKLCDGKL